MLTTNAKAAWRNRYGPAALIAGASAGIGAAFARGLAARGFDVVICARRIEPLKGLAREIESTFSVRAIPVDCDLAETAAVDRLEDACAGVEIGLLVYNAAASSVGPFLDRPEEDLLRTVHVNARGALLCAHRFGRRMAVRGRGGIVLMSSLTAFQGTPLVAAYGATKAYDLVLAEGLWSELRHCGIDVLACCAGATATPGYERVTPSSARARFPRVMAPEAVAEEALSALGRKPVVIPGFGNRLASWAMRRVMSRRRAVETIARAMSDRYGARGRA